LDTLLPIRHVVVLGATDGVADFIHLPDIDSSLAALAPHLRAIADDISLASDHLLQLVRTADIWSWQVRPWPNLAADLENGLRSLGATE
jgi:hypothetical protein